MPRSYIWDTERRRYINPETGRAVRQASVNKWVRETQEAAGKRMQALALKQAEGRMQVAEWQIAMQEEVKQAQRSMAIMANGGYNQMTAKTWGAVGAEVRKQNAYLLGFESDVIAGRVSTAQMVNRAGMYAASLYATYTNTVRRREQDAGMSLARRVLDPAAEHCDDCPALADIGWQPIEDVTPIGETPCAANCRCSIIYGDEAVAAREAEMAAA